MSSKRGFPRDVRAFTAVIRAYGRAGLWREAVELVSTMKVRDGRGWGWLCVLRVGGGVGWGARQPGFSFRVSHTRHERT